MRDSLLAEMRDLTCTVDRLTTYTNSRLAFLGSVRGNMDLVDLGFPEAQLPADFPIAEVFPILEDVDKRLDLIRQSAVMAHRRRANLPPFKDSLRHVVSDFFKVVGPDGAVEELLGNILAMMRLRKDPDALNIPTLPLPEGEMQAPFRGGYSLPQGRKNRKGERRPKAKSESTDKVIMAHFKPGKRFTMMMATEWLVEVKYAANSVTPALTRLVKGEYIRRDGEKAASRIFTFVTPLPTTYKRPR